MARRQGNKPVYKKKKTEEEIRIEQEAIEKEQHRRRNVSRHSVMIVAFSAIFVAVAFIGRWVYAVQDGFYDSYVKVDDTVDTALSGATGLTHTDEENEALTALGTDWDLFTGSRLRDEVYVTLDGDDPSDKESTTLHAGLYYNESDITVIVLQRFGLDSTDDFLAGSALYEETGCNILLPDARCHVESTGDVFGWGYFEQNDIAVWCNEIDSMYGEQKYILWGEGVGANTALFAALNGLLPDSVCAIVAESPYGSVHQLANRNIFKWYAVPGFPFLTAIEAKVNMTDNGFKISDTNLLKTIENAGTSTDIPVLFTYSTGDEFIPADYTTELIEAYPDANKQQIKGSGTHGTVFSECEDEILSQIKEQL